MKGGPNSFLNKRKPSMNCFGMLTMKDPAKARRTRRTFRCAVPPTGHRTNEKVAHVATDPHCRMDTNQATEIQTLEKKTKQHMPSA